jgi:hypothetical protein
MDCPTFLDCGLAPAHLPASELPEHVSGTVLVRPGRAVAATLALDDPDFMANRVYTQVLGCIHSARAGVGVRGSRPSSAETFGLHREWAHRA